MKRALENTMVLIIRTPRRRIELDNGALATTVSATCNYSSRIHESSLSLVGLYSRQSNPTKFMQAYYA